MGKRCTILYVAVSFEAYIMAERLFKPHPDFKKLYYSYLAIGLIALCLSWIVPVSILIYLFLNPIFTLIILSLIFITFILIVLYTAFWIPKFYSSKSYSLSENDIVIEKGVWWKRKSSVL